MNQEITCPVSDFITSFAALDLADSSAANAIVSCAFFVDFCSSNSWSSHLCLRLST